MTSSHNNFTDFHTHILPGIDDGSPDLQTSLKMLESESAQGVKTVCLTPHFYAHEQSLDSFLNRRNSAFYELNCAYKGDVDLRLGAEVLYYEGISRSKALDLLRIDQTDTILIEMPFSAWSAFNVEEISAIRRKGLKVVIAHIERYLSFHNKKCMEFFKEEGILFQSNATFFSSKKTHKKAKKLFDNRFVSVLGSDCHNLESRRPDMSDIMDLFDKESCNRIFMMQNYLLERHG